MTGDPFPSITVADVNRAAALLGCYREPRQHNPPDVKAVLVQNSRRT